MRIKVDLKKYWFKKPKEETSYRMKQVKSTRTNLEITMESLLRKCKIRYKSQPKIYGKPDFLVKDSNILIFCDSSFWHGRRKKELNGEAFMKNKEYWINKLRNNKLRDRRVNYKLGNEGWMVIRFWDTDIIKCPEKIENKLVEVMKYNE